MSSTPSRSVVVIGAGGHGRMVATALLAAGFHVRGFVDPALDLAGGFVSDLPVLGGDDLLDSLGREKCEFAIGVGRTSRNDPRRPLYEKAVLAGLRPCTVVHPSVQCSQDAVLEAGCQVLIGAQVNSGASLGRNVVVNTGAIIEHDVCLGDHAFVASGAILTGGVRVGRSSFIGAGAIVRQGIVIGEDAVVGAGAVVIRDVRSGQQVVGVPARPMGGG